MIWLSFCRGKLGKPFVNRTRFSWECSTESMQWTTDTDPVPQPLQPARFEQEWARHPFPPVKVPEDCYIIFSTLPDSV